MRRHNRAILFVAGLFSLAAILFAQQAVRPPAQPQEPATFTAETNLVVLHASVVDKNAKLITNIPKTAFKVYEDGIEQPIKEFLREDVPVSMGIIIDNSGSMRDKRAKVAAASLALVKASNPQDEVFLVNFNDVAYLDQDFTNDVKKLEEALDHLDARGGTAMRDAISMSIDHAKEKGKHDKKVLVVVTDGNDNTSDITLEQLVRKARQSEVLIYAIGLLSEEEPRDARAAKKALKLLTENSGGIDYYPKDTSEVERITPQIAHDIRSQYMISYIPTNLAFDNTYRKISVTVKGFGNPTVRTRQGRYATAPDAKPPGSTPPPVK